MSRSAGDLRPRHPIVGWSMFPLVRPMRVALTPTRRLRRGDIAVYLGPEGAHLVFHRVLGWQGEALRTRGDLNTSVDPLVPLNAILGRVARVEWGRWGVELPEVGLSSLLLRYGGLSWGWVAPRGLALVKRGWRCSRRSPAAAR